jgi:hypothetical protein
MNDKTEAKDKLSNYMARHSSDPEGMLGQVVFSLILKKLMKKAQEEERENRGRRGAMFEKYHRDRFNEAKYLEMIKAGLEEKKHQQELEKEERQHEYDEKKASRQHGYEIKKQEHQAKVKDAIKQKNFATELIVKSFKDPAEAMAYQANPEKMEEKREMFDDNGWLTKNWKMGLQKVGLHEYKGKMRSRLKK